MRRCVVLACAVASFALAGCGARSVPEEVSLPFRQAEDAFRLGDYDRAVLGYEVFLRQDEGDDLIPRAYYKLALAEFRRGNHAEALAVTDRMERRFPRRHWPQVDELRGDIEQSRGNAVSAVRWWEMAWLHAEGQQRLEIYRRIREAVSEMDPSALAPARAVLQTKEIRALVEAQERGHAPEGAAPPRQPRPAAPRSAAPAEPSTVPRVACLLPLSGAYALYGERSLNGIRLALGDRADRLVVKDTQGKASVARAAIDEVVADQSVVAAIGPLRSRVAESVAVRAERSGLPLVLLSQREAFDGDHVLQPVMTYERQSSQLAEYAVTAMGILRAGVLYPSDGYGAGLAEAFRQEFSRRGGQVVGTLAYAPGAREFSVEALSVGKWIADQGLQAVFIPDYAATAFVLAKELRREHPELVLLGSNGWNDPRRLGQVGGELDGAVFVDGFFAASARPETQAFVTAYRDAYHVAPQILEAQAYDAALMIREALDAGATTRSEVVPSLQRIRTVRGAAGTIGIGPRNIQRELFLLRYSTGTISELGPGPAPASPFPEADPALGGLR